jgi:hypothetical protein
MIERLEDTNCSAQMAGLAEEQTLLPFGFVLDQRVVLAEEQTLLPFGFVLDQRVVLAEEQTLLPFGLELSYSAFLECLSLFGRIPAHVPRLC